MDSVGNNRGMDSVDWVSSGVGRGRSVVGNSLVGDFSNIAAVGISNTILVSIDSRPVIRRLRSVARSSRHTKGSSQQGGQNDDSLHVDVVCLKV